MSQAILGFPERVERALAGARRLATELDHQGGAKADVTSSPEYQEIVRLKVILEVETSRALSEAAQMSSELERTDLARKLASVEEGR
jgi:hypothetical protein